MMACHKITMPLVLTLLLAGCGQLAAKFLDGAPTEVPEDFSFLSDYHPCYLELTPGANALRMNCFHLQGALHIHSSRWAKLPRFSGESWTVSIRRSPEVRVQIDEAIYQVTATAIDDEARRVQILEDRGYWHAWDAITVFRFEAGVEN